MTDTSKANHAGLIVPLEMFRLSQIAAMFAEILVSKARNILDAKLVVTRHPQSPILLMQMTGSVVGENPGLFWRENADLVAVISRAMPRQVIMYYAEDDGTPTGRAEGFIVAAQGQVIAGDDAMADRMPPGATEADWPVTRLAQQLRIDPASLAQGFPGGPRVEVPLMDPNVDDQALLMTLVGQEAASAGAVENDEATAPAPAAAAKADPRQVGADDAKRREKIREEEAEAQRLRAAEIRSEIPFTRDDIGVLVAPLVDLAETEILQSFIVAKVAGDLPSGVPRELTDELQGKRVDVAVRFDFLSEVFLENVPLSKAQFEELAETVQIGGRTVRKMEVLGPRLGYGTMYTAGKPHVFVSRKKDLPIPEDFLLRLLG